MKKNIVVRTIMALGIVAVGFGFFAQSAEAATSGTLTTTKVESRGRIEVVYEWTSTSGGAVTVSLPDAVAVYGYLQQIKTIPDGTDAPTADYDIVLEDEDGYDLLLGQGADRHTSNVETVNFDLANDTVFTTSTLSQTVDTSTTYVPWAVPVQGDIVLKITNAGDSKKGEVRLLFDPRS